MSAFTSPFHICNHPDNECLWTLQAPLVYYSDRFGRIEVPAGFITDLASVPRIPFVFMLWGGRAHREGVIHDFLYRTDAIPQLTCSEANSVFLEAMECRDKPWWVRWPMYSGVCAGGWASYHKRWVADRFRE